MEIYKELELYKLFPEILICGLDEVGRGCCWGPMSVGAVVLKPNFNSNLIADSKSLSERARNEAFKVITENSLAQACCFVSVFALEKFGLTMATKMAMISCIESCKKQLDRISNKPGDLKFILIDAVKLDPELQKSFPNLVSLSQPKFESSSISVAAASIFAKVSRDGLVERQSSQFPRFGLDSHKGYSTAKHFQSIISSKESFLHRKNFVHTLLNKENKYNGKQTKANCTNS